jgi:predicted phosphodiesterase
MKRFILIVVILVLVLGGWYAYNVYQEKTPDVVSKKPDVIITAGELLHAFDSDTAAARKLYIDKIIEVTGNVKKIDTSGSVVLGEEGSASEVTVGLDQRHLMDIEKLKTGSVAVVQGVCSGYDKGSGDDLLASLGTTVELRSAGVKEK